MLHKLLQYYFQVFFLVNDIENIAGVSFPNPSNTIFHFHSQNVGKMKAIPGGVLNLPSQNSPDPQFCHFFPPFMITSQEF